MYVFYCILSTNGAKLDATRFGPLWLLVLSLPSWFLPICLQRDFLRMMALEFSALLVTLLRPVFWAFAALPKMTGWLHILDHYHSTCFTESWGYKNHTCFRLSWLTILYVCCHLWCLELVLSRWSWFTEYCCWRRRLHWWNFFSSGYFITLRKCKIWHSTWSIRFRW